jgi:hypothetical protein
MFLRESIAANSREGKFQFRLRQNSGKIDVWEVESVTDNAYDLFNKVEQVMMTVPDSMKGTIKVLRPKGIVKDVQSANNKGRYLRKTSADADRAFQENLPGFEVVDWKK